VLLCQVALEGRISKDSVQANLARGHRASGDLIPWNISQQFQDSQFANLSGARIVRIAAHPDAQRMGYGTRALQLLMQHFEGKLKAKPGKGMRIEAVHEAQASSDEEEEESEDEESGSEEEGEGSKKGKKLLRETVTPRKQMSPLLVPVEQVEGQDRLHWLGTSFGLTESLLGFWARSGLHLVYMRQTANDLTGEHTVVMLRSLDTKGMEEAPKDGWLGAFTADALRRIVSLLSFEFRDSMDTTLDLAIIDNLRAAAVKQPPITPTQLGYMLVPRDFEVSRAGRVSCTHRT
jgi:N-acetyltransferase 10